MSEPAQLARVRNEERMRCFRAAVAEAQKIRAASPFPLGSGEPVAVAIEQMASGCDRAAKAIWDAALPTPSEKDKDDGR